MYGAELGFFYFFIWENSTFWKSYFIGSGKRVKLQLFHALTCSYKKYIFWLEFKIYYTDIKPFIITSHSLKLNCWFACAYIRNLQMNYLIYQWYSTVVHAPETTIRAVDGYFWTIYRDIILFLFVIFHGYNLKFAYQTQQAAFNMVIDWWEKGLSSP